MYPLIETIRLQHGNVCNLPGHMARLQKSCFEVWQKKPRYTAELQNQLQQLQLQERHKCTVYYNAEAFTIKTQLYQPKQIQQIKFIEADDIEYSLKYGDRACFKEHIKQLPKNTEPVFIKNNLLTDASYANIALWNGNEWHTPLKPLLRGTKRAEWLKQEKITAKNIAVKKLQQYSKLMIINAMLDWEEIVVAI